MAPTRIVLSPADIASIRNAAERAFPHECCGLLVGSGEEVVAVTDVVAAANVAGDRVRHFAIDPQLQFDTLRAARERGLRIVGHYHSHPNGRATPSAEDLAMVADNAVWVIVAVTASGALAPRAFAGDPGGEEFTEVAVAFDC